MPEIDISDELKHGALIELGAKPLDVSLYWQTHRITSKIIKDIGSSLERYAKITLQ